MGRPTWLVSIIKRTFPGRFSVARLTRAPVVGRAIEHMLFEGDDIIYLPKDSVIPVDRDVGELQSIVLPSEVVAHFIKRARHHWIMNFCICRDASGCRDYPAELGCMFLGEAVLGINPELGRLVSREEALAHARRCREAGLVHLIGRNKLDTVWLGVGPGKKLMTICNCCPCCCLWRMIPQLEPNIAEKPAGILVVGFDPALKPSIDKAADAGIPIVTLDAEVYGSKRLTFLGTGNKNAGHVGAKLLAEQIGGKGKVALLTKVGQSNLEERIQGYKDEFAANYPGIELVQIIDDQSDPAKAADGLKAVLQRVPDLAGVGCVEASGGVGAATAAKELDLVGKLKIISMDRDDGTLKFIEDGVIQGSVAQKTALMSYLGTKFMYYLNHAPVPVVADNKAAGLTSMPESVDTGTIVINKDNAKFFYHK